MCELHVSHSHTSTPHTYSASILIKAFVSYFEIRSLNNTANCTATLISQFVLTQGIIQCFNVTVLVASLFVNTWQAFHFLIDHKETRYRILRIAFTVCSIVLGATFLLMVILTTDRVKRRHYVCCCTSPVYSPDRVCNSSCGFSVFDVLTYTCLFLYAMHVICTYITTHDTRHNIHM